MAKVKTIRTHTTTELFTALGLTSMEGAELVFRTELNAQIIKLVQKEKLTNTRLAELVGSSKSKMHSLLNKDISNISTDLMLRVLSALGYKPQLKITKTA